MKKKVILGSITLALLATAASAAYAANTVASAQDGIIVEGVSADGIALSGLSDKEAQETLEKHVDELMNKKITLLTDKHEDSIVLKDLGLEWTNQDIVKEAVALGKSGNLIARFKELTDIKTNGQAYTLDFSFDNSKVEELMETLKSYNQEAKEPTIKKTGDGFVVTEEENGITVDEAATMKAIYAVLEDNKNTEDAKVETVMAVDKPAHTAAELKEIKDVLGSKTTSYDRGNRGRTQSLELSASRCNGTIIWPGETVSISTLMGERSKKGGYGTGQGYFGTNVEETVGAGICQTASTIYCAALEAELNIVERYNHSLIVHYVKYGMDSTIYAGSDYMHPQKDLKLKNDYDYPIYMEVKAGGGSESVKFYGKETRPSNRKVQYIAKTISEVYPSNESITNDPSKPVGYRKVEQGAFPAVKASLTKVVTVDGKEVERTLLHTDTYKGAARKVIVGTKVPATQAPTKPAGGDSGAGGAEGGNAGGAEQPSQAATQAPTQAATQAPTQAEAQAQE